MMCKNQAVVKKMLRKKIVPDVTKILSECTERFTKKRRNRKNVNTLLAHKAIVYTPKGNAEKTSSNIPARNETLSPVESERANVLYKVRRRTKFMRKRRDSNPSRK